MFLILHYLDAANITETIKSFADVMWDPVKLFGLLTNKTNEYIRNRLDKMQTNTQ